MAIFTLNNFHLGGLSQACYQTNMNSLYRMNGFDVHGEHGIIKTSPAMAKQSGSLFTTQINKIVSCSDGNAYFFCNGGYVMKRTNGGTYSQVYDGTGRWTTGNVIDAEEFNGYIYIATAGTLYKWQIGSTWDAVGVTVVGAFTAGDTTYHPMIRKFRELYIGDKQYIAVVDSSGTFTASGLNLGSSWRITCLGESPSEIVIGTTTPSNFSGNAKVFTWNTYSTNVSSEYVVQDSIVNAIMYVRNSIVVSTGTQGALYEISGYRAQRIKQIPLATKSSWLYSPSSKCKVYANSVAYLNGIAHYGVSFVSDNSPIPLGIYSFGGVEDAPVVLTQPFVLSPTNQLKLTISAAAFVYDNQYLVAWKDEVAGTYGVDESGTSRCKDVLLGTGWFVVDRRLLTSCKVTLAYRNIPDSWTLSATVYNSAETSFGVDFRQDAGRKLFTGLTTVPNLDAFRVEITAPSAPATSSGFDVEAIIIETDI